jgi:ABC-type sugar transport system ATPase subunit
MAEPIVSFESIRKTYGRKIVLDGVDLGIDGGDFIVVFGAPLSGKTVLLRLLMGLESPEDGRILVRGKDNASMTHVERNIGYVPQSFALFPQMSVYANIEYSLRTSRMSRSEVNERVMTVAKLLEIESHLKKLPSQLSGGQKQRVALGRGIAKRTDIYVLDDPLAGLDLKLREKMIDDLRELQQTLNATFIYTTSDPLEALALPTRLTVLDSGSVIEAVDPKDMYRSPATKRAMELLSFPGTNFLEGTIRKESGSLKCVTALFSFPFAADDVDMTCDGRPVSVGFHAESLVPTTQEVKPASVLVKGKFYLSEDLGSEEVIYVQCGDTTLNGVIASEAAMRPELDQDIRLELANSNIMVFDEETGARIGSGVKAHG